MPLLNLDFQVLRCFKDAKNIICENVQIHYYLVLSTIWFTTQQEVLSVWVPFFSSKEFSEMLNNMSHAYFLSNKKKLSTSDVQDDLNII